MAYNQELAVRMRQILKGKRGIVEKSMFGGIGFMVNDHLACGIHKQELIVRLGEDQFAKAIKKRNVRIFDMGGRPMKGWVMVGSEACKAPKALQEWIDQAVTYARSRPAK